MLGYTPRVLGLVVAVAGVLGVDLASWRAKWVGIGTFQQHLSPLSQKEVGPRGRRGQDDAQLPRPHRLSPRISVNIGTLFRASTEGSVALRLKNKN